MTNKFRNTYHFIPVSKSAQGDDCRSDAKAFRVNGPQKGDAHDRYSPSNGSDPRWSGRIICRLTTQTPMVIGGQQERSDPNGYARVEPYRWKGRPAIPATALKGLISSIAEAASGSALRVLDDRKPLSYRQPMDHALHALGIIEDDPKSPTRLSIRPLALPLVQRDRRGNVRFAGNKPWPVVFKDYANLKVYLGNYRGLPTPHKANNFASSLPIQLGPQSDPIPGFNSFYYMKLTEGGSIGSYFAQLGGLPLEQLKGRQGQGSFTIFAQIPAGNGILTQEEYAKLPAPNDFVRGLIRILGVEDRQIPNNKKHELFIPYPEGIENVTPLPIPKDVLATFQALARERAEEENNNRQDGADKKTGPKKPPRQRAPYLPFDSQANEEASWEEIKEDGKAAGPIVPKLRAGQIIYFDIARDAEPVVAAISFSAIWRGCVKAASDPAGVHDFFKKIDPNLLPYHDGRTQLTPAERLFGFVSATTKKEREAAAKGGQKVKNIAYAGRVRFSIATLEIDPGEALDNDPASRGVFDNSGADWPAGAKTHTRLKVLGSPKPPSPSLYFTQDFTQANGQPIPKHELKLGKHVPQGRKAYLHQPSGENAPEPQPWKTAADLTSDDQKKLKNAVRPIKAETAFVFHIDFDNLTEHEINLLAFALKPEDEFRHKLGMGKPIGLGTVKIDPAALLLIDRARRYGCESEDVFSPIRWRCSAVTAGATVPKIYEPDLSAAGEETTERLDERAKRYKAWAGQRWPDAIHALILIGKGGHKDGILDDIPVHAPLTKEQYKPGDASCEQDTYEWFSCNGELMQDKTKRQRKFIDEPDQLAPINRATESIPTLRRLTRERRQQENRGRR